MIKNANNKKGGFTLIEFVVALAVFGIITVTVFPAILILNLLNTVSHEGAEATFIAQQAIERIIFESNPASINDLSDVLTDEMVFAYDSSQSASNNLVFNRVEGNYSTRVELTSVADSNLWEVVVSVISSTVDIEGTRAKLETIVSLRP